MNYSGDSGLTTVGKPVILLKKLADSSLKVSEIKGIY